MRKRIANYINRWRHTRGFGVHSPFGYDMVTRVINTDAFGMYGDFDIEAEARKTGLPKDTVVMAKRLLRLVAFIKPVAVFLPLKSRNIFQVALSRADSRMRIAHSEKRIPECELVCSYKDFLSLSEILKAISIANHSVAIREMPEGWDEIIFEALPEGVMFRGAENMYVIHRSGMQKLKYTVNI